MEGEAGKSIVLGAKVVNLFEKEKVVNCIKSSRKEHVYVVVTIGFSS